MKKPGQMEGQMEGQSDGQTLCYKTLLDTTGGYDVGLTKYFRITVSMQKISSIHKLII